MLRQLMAHSRSIRRFDESVRLSGKEVLAWVGALRYCPSAANLQPLRYRVVFHEEEMARVYPTLTWAAYLGDWAGPAPGERPTSAVIVAADSDHLAFAATDFGIAAQSLMLLASEAGYGGCIMGRFDEENLKESFPELRPLSIMGILVMGLPREEVRVDPVEEGSVRYWRDESGAHHVPKRSLSEILIGPVPPLE